MTSLTPNRDAVQKGLDEANRQMAALKSAPQGEFEKRMSIAVMEAIMLSAADMVDAGCSADDVQSAVVSALANVLISHVLNLTGGDRQNSKHLLMSTTVDIGGLALRRLVRNQPDVVAQVRPEQSATGHA